MTNKDKANSAEAPANNKSKLLVFFYHFSLFSYKRDKKIFNVFHSSLHNYNQKNSKEHSQNMKHHLFLFLRNIIIHQLFLILLSPTAFSFFWCLNLFNFSSISSPMKNRRFEIAMRNWSLHSSYLIWNFSFSIFYIVLWYTLLWKASKYIIPWRWK
jgi:hypothetical protein